MVFRDFVDQFPDLRIHSFCSECSEVERIPSWLLCTLCVNLGGDQVDWVQWIRIPIALAYCEVVERIPICNSE